MRCGHIHTADQCAERCTVCLSLAELTLFGILLHLPYLECRAAELRGLYRGLQLVLGAGERLDVLLHVKCKVKEFDSSLTKELLQLIEREADLINRYSNCCHTVLSAVSCSQCVVYMWLLLLNGTSTEGLVVLLYCECYSGASCSAVQCRMHCAGALVRFLVVNLLYRTHMRKSCHANPLLLAIFCNFVHWFCLVGQSSQK